MKKNVAVVIGTGGMGRAIARRIGSGRAVLLADFDEAALTEVADALRGEGHDVTTRVVDVSDKESVAALADAADALGAVTHVAHTAGLSPTQTSAQRILQVDLVGVALVLEEFARVVAPGGAAVVIASMAGHLAPALAAADERALATLPADALATRAERALASLAPEAVENPGAAYAVAKRANVLRVHSAAVAWGERGARVNSISPGVISTPMGQEELNGEAGQVMRTMVETSPTGRLGTPDDIAAAAAFLLDPQAGFITGTDLLVDGGVVAALRTRAQAG